MRELTTTELRQTSGGFLGPIFAPIGALIGFAVGEVVDEALKLYGNFDTNYASAGASLGAGIASLVGLSPIMTIIFMREGILGMVKNGIEIGKQAREHRLA